jgi:flagellar FliL protein
MSENTEAAAEGTEGAPKKSKKKLIIILAAVILLVAGAGVPMFLMGGKKAPEGEEAHEEVEPEKKMELTDLGQFIVNLSESSSFLKVHIMMEYDASILDKAEKEAGGKAHGGGASGGGGEAKKEGGFHPHMAPKETQMRDVIIRILSSKTSQEMLTAEGKERLKDELVEGLNEAIGMEDPPVTSVFFTEFIIQ